MIELLSRIVHLDPPSSRVLVQITRYAPLQTDPERFGIPKAVHEPVYDMIFSSPFLSSHDFDMDDFCYYFARPFQNGTALARIYRRINTLVDTWAAAQRRRQVSLIWQVIDDAFQVTDTRFDAAASKFTLLPPTADVLLALETPKTRRGLQRGRVGLGIADLDRALAELDRLRFVVRDGERWLSVVTPAANLPNSGAP
jgi:hypothetical protein